MIFSIHVIICAYVSRGPVSICSRMRYQTPSILSSQSSASNNVGMSFLINCRSHANRSVGNVRRLWVLVGFDGLVGAKKRAPVNGSSGIVSFEYAADDHSSFAARGLG